MLPVDELLEAIYDYSRDALLPLLAGQLRVRFERNVSHQFNARVRIDHDVQYVISVFDGCAGGLAEAIGSIEDRYETINDSLEALARSLLGTAASNVVLRRFILSSAVMFVVLHELSHVICGHFAFRRDHGLSDTASGSAFDEIEMSGLTSRSISQDGRSLIKHVELDADQMAYEFLLAIGYEFLVANDEIGPHLAATHPPDALPDQIEHAVAECMLFAAAAVIFLIDANHPAPSTYPAPEARVLNLAYLLAARFGPGRDLQNGTHRLALDDAMRDRIGSFVIPAVLNALEFGAACFEHRQPGPSRDAAAGHADSGSHPREAALTGDLIQLLLFEGRDITTPGAAELRDLLAGKPSFLERARPYMSRNWNN